MTVLIECGTTQIPVGSPVSDTVSLSRFQGQTPKALLLMGSAMGPAASSSANGNFTFGFFDGTTNYGMCLHSRDGFDPTSTHKRILDNHALAYLNESSLLMEGYVSTMSADEFSIQYDTGGTSGTAVHYMAIGGPNVQAKAIEFTGPTTDGAVGYTGVGFQPDLLIGFTPMTGTAKGNTVTTLGMCIGVANSQAARCAAWLSEDDVATSNTYNINSDHFLIGNLTDSSYGHRGNLQSMDSDGFTIDWSNTDATSRRYFVLCLKGVSSLIEQRDRDTGTGTHTFTPNFLARGGLFFTNRSAEASTTVRPGAVINFGMSDGTNENVSGMLDRDAQAATDSYRHNDDGASLHTRDSTGNSSHVMLTTNEDGAGSGELGRDSVVADWTQNADSLAIGYSAIILGDEAQQGPTIWSGAVC